MYRLVSPNCRNYSIATTRKFVVVVVVVITPPLPRDGDTARTAIHVLAVNLIDIRLGNENFV